MARTWTCRSRSRRWARATREKTSRRAAKPASRAGASASAEITPDVRQQLRGGSDLKGAVIERVLPGSPADNAGLRPGDVILSVNRQEVQSVADVQKNLRKYSKGTGRAAARLVKRRKYVPGAALVGRCVERTRTSDLRRLSPKW